MIVWAVRHNGQYVFFEYRGNAVQYCKKHGLNSNDIELEEL